MFLQRINGNGRLNILQSGFRALEAIELGFEEVAVSLQVARVWIIEGIEQGTAQGLDHRRRDAIHGALKANAKLNQHVIFTTTVLLVILH